MYKNSNSTKTIDTRFLVFMSLVSLITLFHGGEIEWQFLVFVLLLSLLSFYTLLKNFDGIKLIFIHNKALLRLLSVFIAFQILYLIPLPFDTIHILNPSIIEQHTYTHTPSLDFKLSVNVHATTIELLKFISCILALVLTLVVCQNKNCLLTFTRFLFLLSAIISVYSIFNHLSSGAFDLVSSVPPWTIAWSDAAHGTFSYQNHYAAYIIMTIPLGMGLLYQEVLSDNGPSKKGKPSITILSFLLSKKGLYLFCLLTMYSALIMTNSRGGNSIFIIVFLCTSIALIALNKKTKTRQKFLNISYIIITVIGTSFIIISSGTADKLIQRIEIQGFTPNGRDLMQDTAIKIFKEHPFWGTGPGTYSFIQHKYKHANLGTSEMSKRAHNDYLELLANQGVIGFVLLGSCLIVALSKVMMSLTKNRHSSFYGLKIAYFSSATSILIYSLVEFNFQLPALAIHFFIILGLSLALSGNGFTNRKRQEKLVTSA